MCATPQLPGAAPYSCASGSSVSAPPTSQMPPFRYGRPAAFAGAPVSGPMKSSIVNVVDGPRQPCTSSSNMPAPSEKKWNIRLRPSWPERLPSPCGCAAVDDIKSRRAVSIADPATITMSARSRLWRPAESRYDTPSARRPSRDTSTRYTNDRGRSLTPRSIA